MSADQFASGEVCFMLNKGLTDNTWYQNIGEDAVPVPNATHAVVYPTAQRCDGMPLDGCEFTNDASRASAMPAHNYEGYTCNLCGTVNPDYCEKADGFYLIENADQLAWFALMVNSGNTTVNAKLTANIDFSDHSEMIGSGNGVFAPVNPFRGTFDGDFHTITLNYKTNEVVAALFHYIDGAFIKNLSINGRLESSQVHLAPVAGHLTGNNIFDRVYTDVEIISTVNGPTGDSGFAGIVVNGKSSFNNCGVTGSITGENGFQYGGFIGYSDGTQDFSNCFVAVSFNGGTNRSGTFVVDGRATVLNNCYYLNDIGVVEGNVCRTICQR